MRTKILLVAAAMATATLAVAQEGERIPDSAWATDYIGRYAVDGQCDDPASTWLLNEFQVQFGTRSCTSMGKLTFENEALIVPLSDCREGGTEIKDRFMAFSQAGDDLIVEETVGTGSTTEAAEHGGPDESLRLVDCGGAY